MPTAGPFKGILAKGAGDLVDLATGFERGPFSRFRPCEIATEVKERLTSWSISRNAADMRYFKSSSCENFLVPEKSRTIIRENSRSEISMTFKLPRRHCKFHFSDFIFYLLRTLTLSRDFSLEKFLIYKKKLAFLTRRMKNFLIWSMYRLEVYG